MSARGARARATAFAQWQHEQRRDASPIDPIEDWPEKIARIEKVLATMITTDRERRLLEAELTRLKAQAGLLPLPAAAE